jgi:hypothetical protein
MIFYFLNEHPRQAAQNRSFDERIRLKTGLG